MAFLALVLLALVGVARSEHFGCPSCGNDLVGRKMATVHPGEPAVMLFGISSADACAAACRTSSADVLFYQYFKSKVQGGEPECLCLATCYSVYEADPSEGAVSGSLCRDQRCPATCSNAPTSNVIFLGNPAHVVYQGFAWAAHNGTNATFPTNATLMGNSTFIPISNTTNSTSGNSTAMGAVYGMSFEECRAHAASHAFPPTPFFTHLEAMSACLLFDKCIGVAPAGTATAKSGSFCLPSLMNTVSKREEIQKA